MSTVCLQFANEKAEAVVTKRLCALWDTTTHVKISAPRNNCAAFKCTGLKYITGSLCFGTQLLFYLPKKENPEYCQIFFCHDLNVFRTVVMLWPIVFLVPN